MAKEDHPSTNGAAPPPSLLEPTSPDREAVVRMRLAAGVSLIAELILPLYETSFLARPDWLTILIQLIWFVLTLILLAATWLSSF